MPAFLCANFMIVKIQHLAEQVETKSTSRGVSTDSLAEGVIQVALVRSSLVSADRNRVNDTESKSLFIFCQQPYGTYAT
jgi:hypothetical protein